jgi:hypothetical protein
MSTKPIKTFYPYPKRGRVETVLDVIGDFQVVYVYLDFEFFWSQIGIAFLLQRIEGR